MFVNMLTLISSILWSYFYYGYRYALYEYVVCVYTVLLYVCARHNRDAKSYTSSLQRKRYKWREPVLM